MGLGKFIRPRRRNHDTTALANIDPTRGASYSIATEGGSGFTPRVEVGGGIAWSDPALGLSLDLEGRTPIAHASDDLEDRGSARLRSEPGDAAGSP